MTLHHEIVNAENDLKYKKEAYLRRFGWKSTCHTPGSYWLWERTFEDVDAQYAQWNADHPDKAHKPYGRITADTDLAVSITVRCLDKQEELAKEEE